MAGKQDTRKNIQLWLRERDDNRMKAGFAKLVDEHGIALLKDFRRESTKHEHAILHELVQQGRQHVIKYLVEEHGFDLNVQRPSDLSTPLHMAQWTDQKKLAKLLLALGADANLKNSYGESAYETAKVLKPINASLAGAKTANEILNLIDKRFDDFTSESSMYAFKLLGEKTSKYDAVSCKFVSSEDTIEVQASIPYQRLRETLSSLACNSEAAKDGSVWSTLLKSMTALPDEHLLNEMFVAFTEGKLGCNDWQSKHTASCVNSLAKLGAPLKKWTIVLTAFFDALQGQVEDLHEGNCIQVLWALGQMKFGNNALLVALAQQVLCKEGQPHAQALTMAIWAYIRTSCNDQDLLLRLAVAYKQCLPVLCVHMNVTLPAWCFAKANITDEELFCAIFRRASVTSYESKSRHHKDVTSTERLMQWAQLFFAYCYCCAIHPASLEGLSNQLRKDLLCLYGRQSVVTQPTPPVDEASNSHMFSEASGLRDANWAELDKMIADLAGNDDIRFEDSMAEGRVPTGRVSQANAAMSKQLLGKVPEPVATFTLLEFRRDPEPFHAALLKGPELLSVRQPLEQNGFDVQLPNGPKILCRPEIYNRAFEIATSQELQLRHVLVEGQFENLVMAAITSLPSKLQVRFKNRDENMWVFASKTFPCGSTKPGNGNQQEEEEVTWSVKRTLVNFPVKRTFVEFPVASSMCPSQPSRSAYSA